jgi:cobaltochelatase CobN
VETDYHERVARELVEAMADADWDATRASDVASRILVAGSVSTTPDLSAGSGAITPETADKSLAQVARVLEFACAELVPRLRATSGEIDAVLHALDGGYVPAGPSGSPTRGLVNVLPTGRNFYSVDPKAIPSRTSFETGLPLADSLIKRQLADEGEYPRCVGLTVWGTSAMRTQGDDIAEVLALIGCRPRWDDASRRVTGFEVVPLAELGRPRIDVTLRISGFFRDAFPHVIALLDDAIGVVARLDEPPESNYLRAHALADQRFSLKKYMKAGTSSDDASTARQAVVEGQATWLMSEFLARKTGQSLKNSPALVAMMSNLSENGAGQYPVFESAPLYERVTLIFPYTKGMLFQNAVFERDGPVDGFG